MLPRIEDHLDARQRARFGVASQQWLGLVEPPSDPEIQYPMASGLQWRSAS
jgi:hypothetical protein